MKNTDDVIDVLIACGKNSNAYVDYLVDNIAQTAHDPARFNYIFSVNDASVDTVKLENIGTIVDGSSVHGYSSKSHGIALNKGFKHVKSDIAMILDCDVAFLCRDWDLSLLEILSDDTVIVGTEYPENYEQLGTAQKYVRWPNVIGVMFKTRVLKNTITDFCPAKNIVLTEDNASHYGLSAGQRVRRDTGWQLSANLRAHDYSGVPLKLKYTGRFGDFYYGEKPIIAHCGRSSLRDFNHPKTREWRAHVEEKLATAGL